MELLKKLCKTCGGDLVLREDQIYVCRNCKNEYSAEVAQEHVDKMRSLFDETKLEAVANARKNLYEAVTAEYVSSTRVHECCTVLKQYLPDDFQANFYEKAIGNDGRQIARFIRGIDVEENAPYMETAIRFLIGSLQSEYVLVTGDLIERVFKNTSLAKYEKYSTALSVEAQKLDDCIYMTTYPRDVFVAYSSKDMDTVMDLVAYLEEQGLSCFVAVRNLRHGKGSVENYEKALQEAMDNCASFVFVSTPNSRHQGCDALKKEIPYIKRRDIETAPAEYRNDYSRIPRRFKKHRVEYRVQESPRPMMADRIVADFFDGYERVYSPEEVAERILNAAMELDMEVPHETHEPVQETPVEKTKFCVGCKAECPESVKFCSECGGNKFAVNWAEVELIREIEKDERERSDSSAQNESIQGDRINIPTDAVVCKNKNDVADPSDLIHVVVPNGTERIDDEAFCGCANLKTVTIPASVIDIGTNVFKGCTNLTAIQIDERNTNYRVVSGILYSWDQTILLCCPKQRTNVTIPNSVTTIGEGAFSNCSSLTQILLPDSVTRIGEGAFSYCSSLTQIELPDSVTRIGEGAFSDCSNLSKIILSINMTSIGIAAFANCSNLTQITIPDRVTSIGQMAFQDCKGLRSVSIGKNVTYIGSRAFYGCKNLRSIVIPDGVATIDDRVFQDCENLLRVILGNSIKSIGEFAFGYCKCLTEITIGNQLESIANYAFRDCALKTITLPGSVAYIGEEAFSGCTNLEKVFVENPKMWKKGTGPLDYIPTASLSDPIKAAETLTQTYVDKQLRRTKHDTLLRLRGKFFGT